MPTLRILFIFLATVAFFTAVPANAHEFLWRTESISAEIKRDDQFKRVGHYIQLKQALRPNESGWTTMKIDIPEHWHVKDISIVQGRIKLINSDGSQYELTRDNVGKLNFEILDAGIKSNEQLEKLWSRYARVKH